MVYLTPRKTKVAQLSLTTVKVFLHVCLQPSFYPNKYFVFTKSLFCVPGIKSVTLGKVDLLILILRGFNHERLNLRPAERKWSQLQIVYHLIQAESLSFKYIEQRMKMAESLSAPRLRQRLFAIFVIQALKFPLKFKAPEAVSIVPEEIGRAHV